jgi:8-oxo-dGTP pyrophosphatase MutT (NUDIX family)
LARTRILRVCEQAFECPDDADRSGVFTVIESPDWVNVIALTPDHGEGPGVVLVEQFRYGTGEVTLEIPGGIIDPGEDPVASAGRELLEETGFGGRGARLIGRLDANPAILTNRVATVVVLDAERVGEPTPDQHERIAVRVVPLREIPGLIADGRITHSVIVAAFLLYFLDRGLVGDSA